MKIEFVPGIPIRHYNTCISPAQEPIPHIIINYEIVNNDPAREKIYVDWLFENKIFKWF